MVSAESLLPLFALVHVGFLSIQIKTKIYRRKMCIITERGNYYPLRSRTYFNVEILQLRYSGILILH